MAAALAPNFWVLLLGRVLQAACTGMVMPMVFTVILLVFPREKRGTAMGVIGLIIGFAPAVGPSVAGLLVDTVGWRWLFGIVTILSVCVLVLSITTLKNYGDFKRTTFDVISVALSSVGLICLLYGLSTFASSSNLLITFALIVVGLVLAALFVKRQMSLPVPMLKVDILRTRKYATAVVIIVIVQAALMGTGVITPLYIQGVRGYSATMSGLAMLPGAVIGAFMGLISGRLFDRYGVTRVVIPGAFVALVGAVGLVLLGMDTDFIFIMLAYTVLTMGLQFTMTPLNTWGVNSLDNSVLQHAQGLSDTLNQVAASLGTALLVSISALSTQIAPEASAIEQLYIGDHMAFCTTALLMAVAVLVILIFVRDKKAARVGSTAEGAALAASTKSDSAESGELLQTQSPQTQLPDYAAGFDGVTVDARVDEPTSELLGNYENTLVGSAMNTNPVCASEKASMRDVVRLMAQNDTSGLPIVNDSGDLVGFISDGDVANYLGRHDVSVFDTTMNLYRFVDDSTMQARLLGLLELNVMDIATKRVVSVEDDLPMDEACRILAERRIKKVPVTHEGRLVGALSRRDIVRSLADIIDRVDSGEKQ